MTSRLETSAYDQAVVIDTQVVLEAKPLESLPWSELFPGRVLLLVCDSSGASVEGNWSTSAVG